MAHIPAPYLSALNWIETQAAELNQLVESWANINSWSNNLEGLAEMHAVLTDAFASLGGVMKAIDLPPRQVVDTSGAVISKPVGQGLSVAKARPSKPSVFLSGHMDTVFSPDSGFVRCTTIDRGRVEGPGVVDMKGGLVILLTALLAFEQSPYADQLGWEVFINPDEEVGSMSSSPYLQQRAPYHHVGMVFEPSFADGALVSSRMGAAVYALVSKGRAAHVGRDFSKGINAISNLIPIMQQLDKLSNPSKGVIVNLGSFIGGGPVNIVPELAILKFGLRATSKQEMMAIKQQIHDLVAANNGELLLIEESSRAPKPFDRCTSRLFEEVGRSANLLNMSISWRESGGVCDGNTLAAAGLPTIDTLGAIGGNLHTHQEYVLFDSLVERSKLTALTLMRLANGDMPFPKEV